MKLLATNPCLFITTLGKYGFLNWMPDLLFLKLSYKGSTGRRLHITHPQRFTEKLQWLKLYDRNPLYTKLVDKYEVRNFLKGKIDERHFVKLYGVYDSFDEIDWDVLPDSFIMKCTQGCGCNHIVKNKDDVDKQALRKKFNKWMKKNPYPGTREWPYKNVKPRIICEELLPNEGELPTDFKFYCFNGNPYCCKIQYTVNYKKYQNYFDLDYMDLRVNDAVYRSHENGPPKRPKYFNEMKAISEKLSAGMNHVRIDFLGTGETFFMGEFTFFTTSGYSRFIPDSFDFDLGNQLIL
jgi:hypothetical protein